MPKEIIVEQGQCLMDIAVQHCGKAEALFEIADINNISPTVLVDAGSSLIVPDDYDPAIVKYLKDQNAIPATGDAAEEQSLTLEGIGYWILEFDFKVQ